MHRDCDCLKNPNPEEIKYEISDFLYHMMVPARSEKDFLGRYYKGTGKPVEPVSEILPM